MRAFCLGLLVLSLSACTTKPVAPAPAPPAVPTAIPTAVVADVAVAPPAAPTLTPPPGAATPAVAQGRALFGKYCALCHGKQAEGYAADNAPSLVSTTFQASATDDFLRAGISRGRPGTAMAGYSKAVGGPLDPMDIEAILAFLRANRPHPVDLPPGIAVGDAVKGKVIYDTQCAKCHGTPTQRVDAVHLANPMLLETASDAFLRYAIENGRPGTRMDPWRGKLDPRQIEDVVVYLRTLGQPTQPLLVPPPLPPALPRTGPIVLNPKGKMPTFNLREDRFASLDEVKAALDKKQRIIIADARAPSDWLNLHITGSISTPYYDPKSLDDIPDDGTWVIAYCACPHHASGEVVDQLRKRGYKHTAVLDEGVFAWQHKGYPIVTAPGVLPTPAPPVMVTPTAR
jgi:cytochrome c oxidase cbb3-type subunit 3